MPISIAEEAMEIAELHADQSGAFVRFVRLTLDEPGTPALAESVVAIAQDFGPLGLCDEHGWPSRHHRRAVPTEDATWDPEGPELYELCERRWRQDPQRRARVVYLERVDRWHELAVQARLINDIARRLRSGKSWPTPADWARLVDNWSARPTPVEATPAMLRPDATDGDELYRHRRAITALVQMWIDNAGLTPSFIWSDPVPRLTLGFDDLFGYLATQLALWVLDVRGFAFCAICSAFFEPNRDDQLYCSDLCRADARANSESRRRQRRREEAVKPQRIAPRRSAPLPDNRP